MLADALESPVTVVQAPAGFGKSVAVKAVLPDAPWITLADEAAELEDFVRAFTGLVIPSAAVMLGDVLTKAQSHDNADAFLMRWLLRAIEDASALPAYVVIDDVHVLAQNAARFLAKLMERNENRIRWVVLGRSATHLPVSTWIAYGRASLPILESQLAFREEETSEVLAQVGRFDARLTKRVTELTGGWPAAITFAAISASQTSDITIVEHAIRRMSDGFFAEQTIEPLDDRDVHALCTIALLPYFDVEILEGLGVASPHDWIEGLRDQGVFVSVQSNGEYRLHNLLRDALRAKARVNLRVHLDVLLPLLSARRRTADALRLLRLAGDVDAALALLAEHGYELLDNGYWDLVQSTVHNFPGAVTREHPVALGLRATLEANAGRFARADSLFTKALAHSKHPFFARETAMRFALLLINRADSRAIDLLTDVQYEDAAHESERLAALAGAQATLGRIIDAERSSERALDLTKLVTDDAAALRVNLRAAFVAFYASRPEDAERYAGSALRHAESLAQYGLAARAASILYNVAYVLRSDIPMASWYATQMGQYAEKAGDEQLQLMSLHIQYGIECERGREERVRAIERSMSDLDASRGFRDSFPLAYSRAMRESWSGAFDRSIRALMMLSTDSYPQAQQHSWHAMLAMYLAAAGRRAEAIAHLNELSVPFTAHEAVSEAHQAQAIVYGACANFITGRAKLALRQLGATQFTRTEKIVADGLRELASLGFEHIATPEGGQLVDRMYAEGAGGMALFLRAYAASVGRTPDVPLSPAEIAVLRALSDGKRPQFIASSTGKSVETIRSQIKSAIRKLGVSGQTEAVATARRRGLLT